MRKPARRWTHAFVLIVELIRTYKCRLPAQRALLAAILGLDAGLAPWRDALLAQHAKWLAGVAAPLETFRDWTNHILHPHENWGGAGRAVRSWAARAGAALRDHDAAQAAFSLGAASGYLGLLANPLNTAESEDEGPVYHAFARSLAALDAADPVAARDIVLATHAGWAEELAQTLALCTHAGYSVVLDHYDLRRGQTDPLGAMDETLGAQAREWLGAMRGAVAALVRGAVTHAQSAAPRVELSLSTYRATLDIAFHRLARQRQEEGEARLISAAHAEWKRAGKTLQALSPGQFAIRAAYAEEVLLTRPQALDAKPIRKLGALHGQAPRKARGDLLRALDVGAKSGGLDPNALDLEDPVADCPGVDARFAERLAAAGIRLIGDFLAEDAGDIAARAGLSHIGARDVERMQSAARLAMALGKVAPGHALLLAALGLKTSLDLAAADGEELGRRLRGLVRRGEAQAYLRNARLPDEAMIQRWIARAGAAQTLRPL